MTSGIETELKLSAEPDAIATLLADTAVFGSGTASATQVSTYFDTEALTLHEAGLSLRIRRTGERRVQTVKAESATAASLFARAEAEREISGDVPELDAGTIPLSPSGSWPAPVSPVFTTEIGRTTFVHTGEGSRIELVADRGRVIAGEREEAVSEIELELIEGDNRALFALARTLAAKVPLRLGVRSKSERGYDLLAGREAKAIKAEPIRLSDDMDAADAFAAIAASCLRQFRLNEDRLLATGRAEPLHQARVALRRLRSALTIFREMLAGPDFDRLRGELRWISGLLGDVRNIDVLIPKIDDAPSLAALHDARAANLATLRTALESTRVRTLILDLLEWVTIGAWRDDAERAGLRATPARVYAHALLDRLRRQLRKRGRHLARLTDEERHEVRITGKKLRYAAGFFASLFGGNKAGRRRTQFLDSIEALQTALGELNDLASGRALLAQLGIAHGERLLIDGKRRDTSKLIEDAEDAYDAIFDGKRFWR